MTLLDVRGPTMQKCREALFLFISSISFLFMTFGTLYEVSTYMNIHTQICRRYLFEYLLNGPGPGGLYFILNPNNKGGGITLSMQQTLLDLDEGVFIKEYVNCKWYS